MDANRCFVVQKSVSEVPLRVNHKHIACLVASMLQWRGQKKPGAKRSTRRRLPISLPTIRKTLLRVSGSGASNGLRGACGTHRRNHSASRDTNHLHRISFLLLIAPMLPPNRIKHKTYMFEAGFVYTICVPKKRETARKARTHEIRYNPK